MSNQSRGGRGARGGWPRGDSQRGRGESSRGPGNRDDGFRGGQGGSRSQASPEVFGGERFPLPDPDITKLEDDYMRKKPTLGANLAKLSVNEDFPTRPAYGTKGKPITLWANYFNLQPAKNLVLYRYHVSILPEAKGRKLKRIFDLLIREPPVAGAVTDFKTFLVMRNKVEDMEVEVAYRSEFEDDPQPNTRPYRVKILITGEIEVATLLNYVKSTQTDPNFSPLTQNQILQTLNVLLGHYPQASPDTTTISGNKHFSFGVKSVGVDLGGGLAALRGYFRSVRLGAGRMLVNINVSHAVFFQPGPLVGLINAFSDAYGKDAWELERFLKKVRVETTHLPVKKNKAGQSIPRIKAIIALANTNDGSLLSHPPQVSKYAAGPKDVRFWLESPSQKTSTTFGPNKGRELSKPASAGYISVYDFFQKYHNIAIKIPNIPVLNIGNKENPVYIPAECCHVLPGQASMKTLDPNQTARMIRFACRKPFLNAQSITSDGPQVLGLMPASNPLLASFGIKVNLDMITVPGRVLGSPVIKYKGTATETPSNGSWNMKKVKFTSSATVPAWTCLWVRKASKSSPIEKHGPFPIVISFRDRLRACGLVVPEPIAPGPLGPSIQLDAAGATQTNAQLIESKMRSIAAHQGKIGMIFVLLPDMDAAVYNQVKYVGDILLGIHTICSLDTKAAKDTGRDQYLTNIALKVNCKLLGVNQSLDESKLGIIGEGKTMVVGIDVTHPSPGSLSNAPSIAAVVASTDRFLGQFPCELSIQKGREEMVTDLTAMFKSRLDLWRARNVSLPENILVYRDGVSEGQYQILKDTEIPALRAACDLVYTPNQRRTGFPKISVIVVGKRHHTRFYATREREADRSANPVNGTVVDRGVTSMWNWDFFLQAHTCLQGTVKPAHYYVILDEVFGKGNLKKPHPFPNAADTLEELTHNLCYLFARATKAVSICPPAYYADLACERARCYLSGVFAPVRSGGGSQVTVNAADVKIHPRLQNSMFYI